MSVNTSKLLAVLQELGVEKVDDYERKLQDNAGSAEVSRDLVAEGHAAAMLAVGRLRVEMGDSPDLVLRAGGQVIGAEVKHFRRERQDARDEGSY